MGRKQSEETKKKISEALSGKKYVKYYCESCGIEIFNRKAKYCKDCSGFWKYKQLFQKLNITESNIKLANKKTIDFLKKEYFVNQKSLNMLRDEYNIQTNTLHFFFKKNGVDLKSLTESQIESIELGRNNPNYSSPRYKHGWYTTWDNRKVYLRSSYEFKYAELLDSYRIKYFVENKRIRYYDTIEKRERISIVDFYLPETNTLSEVKSSYTLDLQNMKDRVKAYKKEGYNFKLILDNKEKEI